MANYVKRPIREDGIVLSKIFKEATSEFHVNENGRDKTIPAQPDRYIVLVCSSYEFSNETGYKEPTILEYRVDKEVFKTIKFGTSVEVLYELVSGNPKPTSLIVKK